MYLKLSKVQIGISSQVGFLAAKHENLLSPLVNFRKYGRYFTRSSSYYSIRDFMGYGRNKKFI